MVVHSESNKKLSQKRKSSKSFFNQKKEKDKEKEQHEERDKEKEKEPREGTLQKRTRVNFFKEKKERERAEQEEQERLESGRREQAVREVKERERLEKSEEERESEGEGKGFEGEAEDEPCHEADRSNGRESDMDLSEDDSRDSRDVSSPRYCESVSGTEQNREVSQPEAKDEISREGNEIIDGLGQVNSINEGIIEEKHEEVRQDQYEAAAMHYKENEDSVLTPVEAKLAESKFIEDKQVFSQVGSSHRGLWCL